MRMGHIAPKPVDVFHFQKRGFIPALQCLYKFRKNRFPLAGNNIIHEWMLLQKASAVIGNLRPSPEDNAVGPALFQHFTDFCNKVHIPDITGKAIIISLHPQKPADHYVHLVVNGYLTELDIFRLRGCFQSSYGKIGVYIFCIDTH